jgi:hypothetical protein
LIPIFYYYFKEKVWSTGWKTRVQFPAWAMMGYFLFATASRPVLGPPDLLSNEYRELLLPG